MKSLAASIENKVDDLYFQGRFWKKNEETGEEEAEEFCTVFHTYRTILVGFGKAGTNPREHYRMLSKKMFIQQAKIREVT